MAQIIVAEIDAYDPAIAGVRTLRFGTQSYVTGGRNLVSYSERLWDTAFWAVGGTLANFYTVTNSTDVRNIYGGVDGVAKFVANPSTAVLFLRKTVTLAAGSYAPSIFIYVPQQAGVTSWLLQADAQDAEIASGATQTTFGSWVRVSTSTLTTLASRGFWDFNIIVNGTAPAPGFTFYAMAAQIDPSSVPGQYVKTEAATAPDFYFFDGRIQQPANIKRECFRDGRTFGRTQIGYGEMVLVNNDGALDELLNYSFVGRRIVITLGTLLPNMASPVWTTILNGTMEQADLSWSKVTIRVRDKQLDLAKPLQETRYLGTGGLEGTTDLTSKPKPLVYGKVFNIAPPQIDTTRRIYQLHSGSAVVSVNAVYDRGLALPAGTAYTSQADMEANAPTGNQYRVWNDATAGCFIRIGYSPTGTITADVTQGATRTVGQLFNAILLKTGVPSLSISAADITALDAAVNYEVGVYVGFQQDRSTIDVLDELCASVGAWYGADATGIFRIGRIELPTGTEVATITRTDIIGIERIASRDPGVGVPSWRIRVAHEKLYTVQTDLGSNISDERKQYAASEYRRAQANDASVKTAIPLSPEMEFKTVLVNRSNAGSEAERLLAIYKQRRDVYQVTIRVDASTASVLDLGRIVKLEINRFGMSAGKKFLIIGITTNMRGYLYELTLWG
jgi:hypothetical protein